MGIVRFRHEADISTRSKHVCFEKCRLNRSTQHGGHLAINNDDGLPNYRPIAFSESH